MNDPHEVLEMRRAILQLDPIYREPLVLQVLFGYSTNEIAAATAAERARSADAPLSRTRNLAQPAGARLSGQAVMSMNCQEARLQIGADPGADDPRIAEHIAQCAECARYRQELREMDGSSPRRCAWISTPLRRGLRVFRGVRCGRLQRAGRRARSVRWRGC